MANRDMSAVQMSFEKLRKTLDCHCYFGASGAVTLDGPGSKGVLSITQLTNPAISTPNALYAIALGVNVNSINYVDTYVKTLVCDNVPEIEYSGNINPAASATLAIFRDDVSNNAPAIIGNQSPLGVAVAGSGSTGSFAGGQAFKWIVTAVDALGNESTLSTAIGQEQSLTPSANQFVTVSWTALVGAAGYNVYRTLAGGVTGSETVFVGFTTGVSLVDLGTAGNALYQGGVINTATPISGTVGAKVPNKFLPAYNYARPPYGLGSLTVSFYSGTSPTVPAAGEGMRIQIELGDSGAP
jgi:hypothetical protein